MSSAARLHTIYKQLVSQVNDYQLVQTWADVFAIDRSSPHYEDNVTACVMALRSEIALTRIRLDEIGVPENLTSPGFQRLRDVAAPGLLHAKWHSHRNSLILPECQKTFEWAEWALRDDAEQDFPAEELSELGTELESLESALDSTEMSPFLRDFIQRQVNTIRSALRLYGVQGARPLQDALQKVAGAFVVERARVEAEHAAAPEAAKGLLAKASGVIKKTADACDNLGKIGKFGEQAWTVAGTLRSLVSPFLPELGG